MIMICKQKKIKIKPRIKLNHNIYTALKSAVMLVSLNPQWEIDQDADEQSIISVISGTPSVLFGKNPVQSVLRVLTKGGDYLI